MDSIVFRYQGAGSPDNHELIHVEDTVTGDKYIEDTEIAPGSGKYEFHGLVQTWDELSQMHKNVFVKAGLTNKKRKIIGQ